MPIIVIEGCDGTGKSTLAQKCAEHAEAVGTWDVRIEHYGVPEYDPESDLTIGEQAMNQLLERLLDYNHFRDFIVLDRFHWGEPVYAPVFRPDDCVHPLFGTLKYREFYHVENWLQTVGAVTVYCDAPLETVIDRVVTRGEPDLINDSGDAQKKTEQIMKRYSTLLRYVSNENRRNPTAVEHVSLMDWQDTFDVACRVVDIAEMRTIHVNDVYRGVIDGAFKGSKIAKALKPKLMEADR